jgi:hypothetical protein
MPIALAPFDAARDFVAQTNFRADGTIWMRKRPFDKYRVSLRVLRQLYEARKIAYGTGEAEPEQQIAPQGDETPEDKHDDQLGALGAEGLGSGQGGPDSDSDLDENQTSADAAAPAAPDTVEAAAAPEGGAATAAAAVSDPLDHDGDGKKGGSLPDDHGDRETVIKRLVKRNNHEKLFAKASGLPGVTKDQSKAEIAAALFDAGRVGDGTA